MTHAGQPMPLDDSVWSQMRRVPRANTKPEIALRLGLHRRGMHARVQVLHLPGQPVIALTRARVAVFVDG